MVRRSRRLVVEVQFAQPSSAGEARHLDPAHVSRLADRNRSALINVFDAELPLTTTTKSSRLFYTAERIVDSGGSLYAIKKVSPVGEVHSAWRDMGFDLPAAT